MITPTLSISSLSSPDSNVGQINLEAVRTLLQRSPGLPVSIRVHLFFQKTVWKAGI